MPSLSLPSLLLASCLLGLPAVSDAAAAVRADEKPNAHGMIQCSLTVRDWWDEDGDAVRISLVDGQTRKETTLVSRVRLGSEPSSPIQFSIPDGCVSILRCTALDLGDSEAEADSKGQNGVTLGVRIERSNGQPYEANFPGYTQEWTVTLDMRAGQHAQSSAKLVEAEAQRRQIHGRMDELTSKKSLTSQEKKELAMLKVLAVRADIAADQRRQEHDEQLQQYMSNQTGRGEISPVIGEGASDIDPQSVHNLLVTGVGTDSAHSAQQAAALSKAIGQPLRNIANSRGSQKEDLVLAAATQLNPQAAMDHDPTSQTVFEEVARAADNGEEVRLWGHSKGARDVQIALWKYTGELSAKVARGEITPKEKAARLASVKVMTLGGADIKDLSWPPGVSVLTVRRPGDPVPKVAGSEGGFGTAVGALPDVPSVVLGGQAQQEHSLMTYIGQAPAGSLSIP